MKISFLISIFLWGVIITSFAQTSETYQYDTMHQLHKVIKSNGNTITFQYDEVGNRIGMIVINNQTTDFNNNISQLGVKLYPNPTSESFCISGFDGKATLMLTNINGIEIFAKEIINNESISTSNFPKGVYIVKLITTEGIVERKLVKK